MAQEATTGRAGAGRRGPRVGETVRLRWWDSSWSSATYNKGELETEAQAKRYAVTSIGVLVGQGANVVLGSEQQPSGDVRHITTVPVELVISLDRVGSGWADRRENIRRPASMGKERGRDA